MPQSATMAKASRHVGTLLRGLGQVMFQESALSGFLFFLGLLWASPLMALGGLLGSGLGSATAVMAGYDRDDVARGLYGYNGSLTGIALLYYHQATAVALVLVVAACCASSYVAREMRRLLPWPVYTAPFVVTTWVALAVAQVLHFPAAAHPQWGESLDLVTAASTGFSEIMFQDSVVCGSLFFLGILVRSPAQAVWAFAGSVLGMLTAYWHHDPLARMSHGLYGYNAVLVAIALATHRRSLILPILGVMTSVLVTEAFMLGLLAPLTAPFVLTSWLMLTLDAWERRYQRMRP